VRRQDGSDLWKEVRYVALDASGHAGPFEDWPAFLTSSQASWGNPHCELLAHGRCRGFHHLRDELSRVEALGGEGLMLRQPGSGYAAGRSSTLLKVEGFLDADAVVVGREPGRGWHAGWPGAVARTSPLSHRHRYRGS
jgi:DNA ligase-1